MRKNYDLTGRTFGYLTVLCRDASSIGERNSKWICRCKCGNTSSVAYGSLIRGKSKSCGCMQCSTPHAQTHGMSKTRIHTIWMSMNNRCRNSHGRSKTYVANGITVCDEWQNDFMSFYTWSMNNGYSDDLSIDRIDNTKGYFPNNCRWIPIEKQQSNKSNTVYIDYNGERRCLHTLCNELGFSYKTAHSRVRSLRKHGRNLTAEQVFRPIAKEKSKNYNFIR